MAIITGNNDSNGISTASFTTVVGGGTNYIKGNKDIDTLDSVNVTYNETAQVSASERAKIIPENIVKGVNILGVTGTAEGGGGGQTPFLIPYMLDTETGYPAPVDETPTHSEVYEAFMSGRLCICVEKEGAKRRLVLYVMKYGEGEEAEFTVGAIAIGSSESEFLSEGAGNEKLFSEYV